MKKQEEPLIVYYQARNDGATGPSLAKRLGRVRPSVSALLGNVGSGLKQTTVPSESDVSERLRRKGAGHEKSGNVSIARRLAADLRKMIQ